jgi:hypothetical protein
LTKEKKCDKLCLDNKNNINENKNYNLYSICFLRLYDKMKAKETKWQHKISREL